MAKRTGSPWRNPSGKWRPANCAAGARGDGRSEEHSDGIKETPVRHYKNVAGDKAVSMTPKDRLGAWSVESRSRSREVDLDRTFVIRSRDGTFDERYSLDGQLHVPDGLT